MGRKVTIDSATLMNKGLGYRSTPPFCIPYENIEVVIHPQSIIHSMVEFSDGAVKAQLSPPDMRLPIQYALSPPARWDNSQLPRLELPKIKQMDFAIPDYDRFPCLKIAIEAGKKGGTYPAVLCAADEVAVELFLKGQIQFRDIATIVEEVLSAHNPVAQPDLEDILAADEWARVDVARAIKKERMHC
jgi:1-deoxy-D-xylulose-5-phosphate reductoisomerase